MAQPCLSDARDQTSPKPRKRIMLSESPVKDVLHRSTVTHGSGKRRRRAFDPNAWSASIPSKRTNVLCLGVSYACAKSQIRQELDTKVQIIYAQESVEQAIELVRRNVMTQMDGRDLARCLALESSNDTLAYTVSLESGATYNPRHFNANFNRPNFVESVKRKWGKTIKFRQIILDYFWIPRGSWVMTHWTKTFFATTLPGFVTGGILDYSTGPVLESEDDFSPSGTGGGVVYLPFCLHCVKQIVAHIDTLAEYYHISFLAKWELSEHALWAGTSTIDPDSMQNWLGKAINQEDIYCTFTPHEFFYSTDDAHVRKEDILKILNGIENFMHIRMIKLKALSKYNPANANKMASIKTSKVRSKRRLIDYIQYEIDEEKGGFVGLKKNDEVKCGFGQISKGTSPTKLPQKSSYSTTKQSDKTLPGSQRDEHPKSTTKKQSTNTKNIKPKTSKKKLRIKNHVTKKAISHRKDANSKSSTEKVNGTGAKEYICVMNGRSNHAETKDVGEETSISNISIYSEDSDTLSKNFEDNQPICMDLPDKTKQCESEKNNKIAGDILNNTFKTTLTPNSIAKNEENDAEFVTESDEYFLTESEEYSSVSTDDNMLNGKKLVTNKETRSKDENFTRKTTHIACEGKTSKGNKLLSLPTTQSDKGYNADVSVILSDVLKANEYPSENFDDQLILKSTEEKQNSIVISTHASSDHKKAEITHEKNCNNSLLKSLPNSKRLASEPGKQPKRDEKGFGICETTRQLKDGKELTPKKDTTCMCHNVENDSATKSLLSPSNGEVSTPKMNDGLSIIGLSRIQNSCNQNLVCSSEISVTSNKMGCIGTKIKSNDIAIETKCFAQNQLKLEPLSNYMAPEKISEVKLPTIKSIKLSSWNASTNMLKTTDEKLSVTDLSKAYPLKYYLALQCLDKNIVLNDSLIDYCHKAYYTPPKNRFKRQYRHNMLKSYSV